MPSRNEFFLRFNGRNDNLGDQLIFRSLIDALLPFGIVHIRGKMPDFVGGLRPLRSGWKPRISTAANRLRGNSAYDFDSPGGRTWTTPNSKDKLRRLSLGNALFGLFAPARIAIGVSVIPVADHTWVEDHDWVGARDNASLTALLAAGKTKVQYFPDLTFLSTFRRQQPQHLVRRRNICLSFRSRIPETHKSPDYERLLREALSVSIRSYTVNPESRALLYHQVDEDAEFVRCISQRHCISLHGPRLTLDSFADFYQSAQLVISNRLHCLLLGAYCGAVPVAFTSRSHTKLTSLFETIGWKSLILFTEDIDEIEVRLNYIQENLSTFRLMVETTWDNQRRLGMKTLEQQFGNLAECRERSHLANREFQS